MKEFIRNFKLPIILCTLALAVVAVTLFVVTGGFSSSYGLYITSANGVVSVTNSDVNTAAVSGEALKMGDIITVGSNSSCTVAYQGKKNSEKNYIVIGPDTQIVVSNEFNGKTDGEMFLRNGVLICNFAGEDKSHVNVRTADSMISAGGSVAKISYYTNEFISYTDLYTFMGSNTVQLYDQLGNAVNKPEMQIEKKWGRVVSEEGPSFEALNLDIDLNELTAFDLKNLITICALTENFPYTAEELKAVYDTKSDSENVPPIEEQTSSTETSITDDNSDTIQTAEPIVTTAPAPTETTIPGHTAATTTTPPATTTAPPTTTQSTQTSASSSSVIHMVTIVIDGEETIQEIPHGENAVKPEDPVIEGLTFIGWDNSFENVTEDRVITAMFNENLTAATHTVTVVIGDKSNTLTVEHGKSANLPTTLNIEGYVFKGWDKDFTCITSDVTITAILEAAKHTVTFIIGSDKFEVEVEHNGSVMPPYIPLKDSNGNPFSCWDKSLDNIIDDTTITAIFKGDNVHEVTFIIDGQFYFVMVNDGEDAVPPFTPTKDSNGNLFITWDKSLKNITENTVITAIYG